MNILNHIRIDRGLTFAGLGAMIGVERHVAWKHCHGDRPPAEAAIRYSAALGVPMSILRPDLPAPFGVARTSPTESSPEVRP